MALVVCLSLAKNMCCCRHQETGIAVRSNRLSLASRPKWPYTGPWFRARTLVDGARLVCMLFWISMPAIQSRENGMEEPTACHGSHNSHNMPPHLGTEDWPLQRLRSCLQPCFICRARCRSRTYARSSGGIITIIAPGLTPRRRLSWVPSVGRVAPAAASRPHPGAPSCRLRPQHLGATVTRRLVGE